MVAEQFQISNRPFNHRLSKFSEQHRFEMFSLNRVTGGVGTITKERNKLYNFSDYTLVDKIIRKEN
jgi:hypothetical protein